MPVLRSYMPYQKTFSTKKFVQSGACHVTIYLYATATVDGQYGKFLSADRCYTDWWGTSVGFESWTQTTASCSLANNGKALKASARGYVIFSRTSQNGYVVREKVPVTLEGSWSA